MKRVGFLWDRLVSFENLHAAYLKARRGKRTRPAVERFAFRLEAELTRLRLELMDGTYRPGPFRSFPVNDGKPRIISAAPFRDRIVHHALCAILEPVFEPTFISDSYACRIGKGTHAALARYQLAAKRNRYVLACDVAKFFPSIDHRLLEESLERKVKDERFLSLASVLIAHRDLGVGDSASHSLFPGDDLLTALERPRGLPLGNQTSQFFANVFLNRLDHFVKDELKCRDYIRYADDFLLLDDDSKRLGEFRARIDDFLTSIRLRLHARKQTISRTSDGLNFLGFRNWPEIRRLSNSGRRRLIAKLRRYRSEFAVGRIDAAGLTRKMAATAAHLAHASTSGLRERLFAEII